MSDEPHKVDRARPRVAATRFGTVMLLPQSGRIGADVNAAIEASGAGEVASFTDEEIERLIRQQNVAAGLRAEAGYRSGPMVVILAWHSERLANGKSVGWYLTLSSTPAGDAIYFNVTVKTAIHRILARWANHYRQRELPGHRGLHARRGARQMGHVLKLEGELEEATAWDDALTAICSAYLGAAMDILNQLRAVGGGPSTEYSDGQAEVPDGEV
jgi:hypothetical protein